MSRPQLLAEELDTLALKEVCSWRGMVIIDILDKQNMTEERWQRLVSLVRQRDQRALSSTVDADELEKKLSNIPLHVPYNSDGSSAQSTPEPDYSGEAHRIGAYKWYNKLIEMGGRPSAPINTDPGVWNYSLCDEVFFLSRHWGIECERAYNELRRWKAFRLYQRHYRQNVEKFEQYSKMCDEFRKENSIPWTMNLQLYSEGQTKLDEWKEYCLFHNRNICRLENRLKQRQIKFGERCPSVKMWSDRHCKLHSGWCSCEDPDYEAEKGLRGSDSLWCGYMDLDKFDVKKLRAILDWMEGQILVITADCASLDCRSKSLENYQEMSMAHNQASPSGGPDEEQVQVQPISAVAVRRSRRISKQATEISLLGPIHSSRIRKIAKSPSQSRGPQKPAPNALSMVQKCTNDAYQSHNNTSKHPLSVSIGTSTQSPVAHPPWKSQRGSEQSQERPVTRREHKRSYRRQKLKEAMMEIVAAPVEGEQVERYSNHDVATTLGGWPCSGQSSHRRNPHKPPGKINHRRPQRSSLSQHTGPVSSRLRSAKCAPVQGIT